MPIFFTNDGRLFDQRGYGRTCQSTRVKFVIAISYALASSVSGLPSTGRLAAQAAEITFLCVNSSSSTTLESEGRRRAPDRRLASRRIRHNTNFVAACVSNFCALLSASLAGKPFVFDLHLQSAEAGRLLRSMRDLLHLDQLKLSVWVVGTA
jgi:hypothetical protein